MVFLGKATRKVMTQEHEATRVGCFERTGFLLTLIASHEPEQSVKPQGMMTRSLTVPTQSVSVGGDNEDDGIGTLVQSSEEETLAEEQTRIDDDEDDSELDVEIREAIEMMMIMVQMMLK